MARIVTAAFAVLALLVLALIGAAPMRAFAPGAPAPLVVGARQWASEDSVLAFAQPWAIDHDKSLVAGRDFANSISWQKGDLASVRDVQLTWRWPGAWRRTVGVWGYTFVSWGSHEGGDVRKPIAPRQISALAELSFAFGIDTAADPAAYNGLMETFLTRQAGGKAAKALEVGWYWYAPTATQTWAKGGRQLGSFKDRYGRTWSVALQPGDTGVPFATFTPAGGLLTWGSIDAKAGFDFLARAGVVDRSWWFNGMAIGVEPLSGLGTVVIRNWTPTIR